MKHQVCIAFAASLKGKDGDGIRLCIFVKDIPSDQAPSSLGAKLMVAGFTFIHDRKPSRTQGTIVYVYEPDEPVRYEWFTLDVVSGPWRRELRDGKRDREHKGETCAGVLPSRGGNKITTLINRLKTDGYTAVIGNRADSGFKPYDRPTR